MPESANHACNVLVINASGSPEEKPKIKIMSKRLFML
jgi:hypothetical protein